MSNELTIEQMNEVIGVFMGGLWKNVEIAGKPIKRFYYEDKPFMFVKNTEQLCYHNDWNELMPVIKKVRWMHTDLLLTAKAGVGSYIKAAGEMNRGLISCDIDKAHNGVYQFIQWYNKQQSNEHQPK
jgi:hypothetical protein